MSWPLAQQTYYASRARALAALEAKALGLTPGQARQALATWAATGGRMQLTSIRDIAPVGPDKDDSE